MSRTGAKPSQRLHKASSTLEDTTAKDVFVVVEVLRLKKQKLHGQAIHSVMPVSGVIAQGVQRISEHTVHLIPSIDCTLKAPYCDLSSHFIDASNRRTVPIPILVVSFAFPHCRTVGGALKAMHCLLKVIIFAATRPSITKKALIENQ